MRVQILVTFEVESDQDGLDEKTAKEAAEKAAFDYLSLVTISGVNTDVESVVVHVDGFGECSVALADE